jgi:hypothetical protein
VNNKEALPVLDVNQPVKLSVITTTLSRFAKRALSNTEKNYLYEIVQALGTGANTGPHQGGVGGLTMADFEKECGIDPTWAKAA